MATQASPRFWIALLLFTATPAMAQQADSPWQPGSQLPGYNFFESVCLAKLVGAPEQLALIRPQYQRVPRSVTVTLVEVITESRTRSVRLPDGSQGVQEYTVAVPVTKQVEQTIMASQLSATRRLNLPLEKARAWDASLVELTADQIRTRLAQPRHVVLVDQPVNDQFIGSYYRRVLATEVLFVYVAAADLAMAELSAADGH